ncbi:MAG: copper chaperone PCu(A)C [Pseudomonadota bacterium]
MKITPIRASAALQVAATLITATASLAGDYKAGDLKIGEPWTRVTPPGAAVAGGFMTITNTGKEADRLLGGSATISKRLEVHEMTMDGGIMKMRELAKGLEIKPGETVELKPGSFHVMFIELTTPPAIGTPVKGQLKFEKAGTVDVEYKVAPLGAKSASDPAGKVDAGGMGHHGKH